MLNKNSLHAVEKAPFGAHFVAPLYDSYCFANIPGTIKHLLGAPANAHLPWDVLGELPREYKKIILLYVDAFGWDAFERARDAYPFLERFAAEGVVSKITSQFPSTTAAHVTTLYSDLPVGASGVYEWFYYEPLLERVICPLLYCFAGDKERGTLAPTGAPPQQLFPTRTLHQDLQRAGVHSFVFQHAEYTPSPYSDVANAGATQVFSYSTFPEACILLAEAVKRVEDRALFFLYFDNVDGIGHEYGPESIHYAAELDACLTTLERSFYRSIDGQVSDTLLLLTTDHGQASVRPETTFYLNLEFPEIIPLLATDKRGQPLAPAGSPRDFFLHVHPEHLDAAADMLTERLQGVAEVHKVAELIEREFFGATISETFTARVGDLVILPYADHTVWWYEWERFEMKHRGMHGGLSRAEMEIPFLALAL